jgi:hypothetical protein
MLLTMFCTVRATTCQTLISEVVFRSRPDLTYDFTTRAVTHLLPLALREGRMTGS